MLDIVQFLIREINSACIRHNLFLVKLGRKKYEEFGLDSLLQETRGGRNHAYMTVEEEKAFLARHLKATEAGEFVTIDALFQAYKKELGRSYTRDAFYQLLKRHGWRNIMPRPEHPKKADAQTIVASKNKISIQEDKKAF
ncbi:transposase [Streptococcus pneumoniae]|nr:transposase [Streptococcus pneumoniae]